MFGAVLKWAIICAAIGLAIGLGTGYYVGMQPEDSSGALELALRRGLSLGLVGLIVGGAGGWLEWAKQEKHKAKEPG